MIDWREEWTAQLEIQRIKLLELKMTERTSERIWRAARAAYESRGQLKVFMPWDDLRQVSRDIEYDAMVAAFDAASAPALKARLAAHPGCMAPDGAEPCPQYTKAIERVRFLEGRIDAAVVELQRVRADRDRWKVGKSAPPSEEDMKYDNDGYPDLPREPTVTIPYVQHEALMAAAKVLSKVSCRWAEDIAIKQTALAALRATGIDLSEDKP